MQPPQNPQDPYGQVPGAPPPAGYGGGGFGQAPPPMGAPGAPQVEDGKQKAGKMMTMGGGCGCVIALLMLLGGVVLIAFGTQRATREAMPFGVIMTATSVFVAIVGGVLLAIGMSMKKKAG